ncbi:MAG: hypothetical protein JRI36_07735 [Deltaproteobacteria bacterium]|nr:hypothetical protein [Deltaproteobacteria bacterium]
MKAFLVYLAIGIGVIVVQTTVLTLPRFEGVFYDLLIPMAVFARLNLTGARAWALILATGFVMDLFSGGPFGLYMTVYFWIFVGVRGVSKLCDVQGALFRSLLVGVCVLAEHVVFCVFFTVSGDSAPALLCHLGSVLWQVVFGGVSGPALIRGLEMLNRRIKAAWEVGSSNEQDLAIP